jgi:hypothetical protein
MGGFYDFCPATCLTSGCDVPASLAAETIESVTVRGVFRASPEVKAALAARIH